MQVYHPTKGARIPLLNSDNRKAEVLLLSLYYHYLLSPSCYWLIRKKEKKVISDNKNHIKMPGPSSLFVQPV